MWQFDNMKNSAFLTITAILALSTSGYSVPSFPGSADLVTDSISGLVLDSNSNLVHYSGYLESLEGVQLHYWFFESQNSVENDPIVLWLNGGPGCSSMLGALTEHGPLRLERNGDLKWNPHSWNQNASIVYMESPAGVGYSFNSSNHYRQNDETTAELNHEALKSFFVKFPHLKKNRFFISGESYGGIYLPMLAERLVDDKTFEPKLTGMLIGNGYLDINLLGNSLFHFQYYHGILTPQEYRWIMNQCCRNTTDPSECKIINSEDYTCRTISQSMMYGGIFGLNVYNILGACHESGIESSTKSANKLESEISSYSYEHFGRMMIQDQLGLLNSRPISEDGNSPNMFDFDFIFDEIGPGPAASPICEDQNYIVNFLNSGPIKKALHISSESNPWAACRTVGYSRKTNSTHEQVKKVALSGVKTLLYAGDADTVCNFIGIQWFVEKLGFPEIGSLTPWYVNNQVAGMMRKFEHDVSFTTIRSAGHMVPLDRSVEALKMFNDFIQP